MRWAALAALLAGGLAGCDRPGVARSKSYKVVGIVRIVDPKAGTVTLRHEEIPGYMKAMTMPFRVPKTADNVELLEHMKVGDKVEGRLVVTGDDSTLEDLELVEYAPQETVAISSPTALAPGEPVPDFAMTTQEGKALKLSDLRGEVVVLTFIYTRCPLPNACPLMDRKFGELAGQIGAVPGRADRVRLLSVSFDPEHDTPAVLAAHAKQKGAKPPLWTFAVATHDELRKVVGALGMMYGPGQDEVIHSLSTAVIAPDGTLDRLETGGKWAPADLLKAVVGLLRRPKG